MPPESFSGADFRLQSVSPIGLATIRARFTQDPKTIDANSVNDALNIDNYTLTGSTLNYVIAAGSVSGDPQSVDLYLAAPLELGEWTLAVANVEAENDDALEPPLSLTFTVTSLPTMSPVSGGAVNDDTYNVFRKFLNPALKGKGWESLLKALAAGNQPNWDNAKLAFNQLYTSTASGVYLDRRAGDQGFSRPPAIAMPDDLFRELVIVSRASKLTQQALLDILEVYYGSDTVRASSTTALSEPFLLEDGDDLQLLVDERDRINVVFNRGEFARIGQALAIEVAAAITRTFRAANSQAFAVVTVDEETGDKHVRIYSGRQGISSTVRVLGGKAQPSLSFPQAIFAADVGPNAIWTATLSDEPGWIRFSLTGTSTFDLNKVVPGDRVLIYGMEFDDSGCQGSFEVKNVVVEYQEETLVQYFEIECPDGLPGAFTQLRPKSLAFYRPVKRSIYHQPRRVIVTQTDGEVEILIPATTQAVGRTSKTGAYNVLNESIEVSSLVRAESGAVTVETSDPHGLAVGDVVLIDNAFPEVDEFPVTPGSSSGGFVPPPPAEMPYIATSEWGGDSYLLVVGGRNISGSLNFTTAKAIDNDDNELELPDKPGPRAVQVYNSKAGGTARFPNGDVLFVGGDAYNIYVGSPSITPPLPKLFVAATQTWQSFATMPNLGNPTGFYDMMPFVLPNGDVLVVGTATGSWTTNPLNDVSTVCYVWDSGTNTWSLEPFQLHIANQARGNTSCCQLSDGSVLAVCDVFDPGPSMRRIHWAIFSGGAWGIVNTFDPTTPPGVDPGQINVVSVGGGKALMLINDATNSCYLYDGGVWTATGSPNTPRTDIGATNGGAGFCGSCAGEAFLVGGTLPGMAGDYTDSIEKYSVSSGLWTNFDTLPDPTKAVKCLVQCNGAVSVLYCVSGQKKPGPTITNTIVSFPVTATCGCD